MFRRHTPLPILHDHGDRLFQLGHTALLHEETLDGKAVRVYHHFLIECRGKEQVRNAFDLECGIRFKFFAQLEAVETRHVDVR